MEIKYYSDHRGGQPVYDFIEALSSPTEINQVTMYLKKLSEQGFRIRRPLADFLRDGIYELRPGYNRILYSFAGGKIVLLHALRKTNRAIPDGDIDLALRRLELWKRK